MKMSESVIAFVELHQDRKLTEWQKEIIRQQFDNPQWPQYESGTRKAGQLNAFVREYLDGSGLYCRRFGHRWVAPTVFSKAKLETWACGHGCGARSHRLRHGQVLTPGELAALMPANGRAVVSDVEIIVERDGG